MKLSIVTVCVNAESTILEALESVKRQTYSDVEHIVVDGSSRDGTMKVIESNPSRITTMVSEPDNGIYDAMNKGIALAKGDIVGFLNADDFYAVDTVLESVAKCFQDTDIDVVYGDICYVKRNRPTKIVRYWKSSEYRPGQFERGWCPPHPTFFVRREIYEQPGGYYDTGFKLAADFELIVRYLAVNRLRSRYLPEVLVKMRMGGETNRNLSNILSQNREILKALKLNGLKTSVIQFVIGKILSRTRQFLVRPPA